MLSLIASLVVIVILGNKLHEKILLSQKRLDLPDSENVYKIYFMHGAQWYAELTDTEYITQIMESLSNARATNITNYYDIALGIQYTGIIYYLDENGESQSKSFDVSRENKKYYIYFVEYGWPEGEVWQIDEELHQLLFETTIKLRAGELD